MRIVDSHHHFWDPGRATYPWMVEALEPINRRFGPEDLEPLLDEAGVYSTVLVQTRSSLDETREFLQIAAANDFVAGVVGWVDLTAPDVEAALAGLRAGPGGETLVAIRHQVHDEPDANWLIGDAVQRGIAEVGQAGLAYDLLVRPRELPAALETVRRHPDVRFVIDHLGKPIVNGFDPAWQRHLPELARIENVSCKLSGLTTEADWESWRTADLVPYVWRALDWFGDTRLMFGSDWPVCLLAGTYRRTLDAYLDALGNVPAQSFKRIFETNCVRFYGLRQRTTTISG
jgi:L-fuconolactonase